MSAEVLVLNSNYNAVNAIPVFDAVRMVVRRRAMFLDPETYMVHSFESWVNTWKDASNYIGTTGSRFRRPEIIVLKEYSGMGFKMSSSKVVKFSRRNVYLRDNLTCQYCGKKCDSRELNLDHIMPKSRGGAMSWTNIVLSCIPCNDKKKNRTPKEAGMKLIRAPFEPKPGEIKNSGNWRFLKKIGKNIPKTWEAFVDKKMTDMYWTVSLKD